jgi:competence protein ComEA
LVLLFLAVSICLGSIVLYTASSSSDATETSEPIPESAPAQVVPPDQAEIAMETAPPERAVQQLHVSVAGAVRQPGVFQFDEDDRVQDAIDSAGGTEDWADMTDINLAAYLIDGTTLTIPGEPEEHAGVIRRPSAPPPNPAQYTVSGWQAGGGGPATDSASGSRSNGSGGIDLNRASAAELETLPGIGPKLAGEIIRFRDQQPFRSVDDLDLVSGIGGWLRWRAEAGLKPCHVPQCAPLGA